MRAQRSCSPPPHLATVPAGAIDVAAGIVADAATVAAATIAQMATSGLTSQMPTSNQLGPGNASAAQRHCLCSAQARPQWHRDHTSVAQK